jgi:hypothetical protein
MGRPIGTVGKTAVIYLILMIPVVLVVALLVGGFGTLILLGSLPFLLLIAIPGAVAVGVISLLPLRGGVGRIARGVLSAFAAAGCGSAVTFAYMSQLDYGPYANELPGQRASMTILDAALFAIVGLITGLVVGPHKSGNENAHA